MTVPLTFCWITECITKNISDNRRQSPKISVESSLQKGKLITQLVLIKLKGVLATH